MSQINISNLTFAYEGTYDNIFEDVSFQMDTDWRLGFTGRNGRGKTTFLNLLLGKYEYTGNISASVSFEYFPYMVTDNELDTIEVINSIYSDYQHWEIIRELSLLDVAEDILYRPYNTLSNGEQTKVLLAILFLKENSFLLIDEPTNHLDIEARETVSRYLSGKKGYILVSHDRVFLDNCVDHILSINKANIDIQKGNFSSWWRNKQAQDNFELEENKKLKRDIRHLTEAARRTAEWSDKAEARKIGFNPSKVEKNLNRRTIESRKSKKMMRRSKAIEGRQQSAIEDKSKLLKNIEDQENLKITQLEYHSKRMIDLDNITLYYGSKAVVKDISFTIFQGDRIALRGRNGSGKSSIIKLICGQEMDYTGTFYIGNQILISYVPQDTSFLKGDLTSYSRDNKIDESLFKAIVRKLDFSRVQFEKDMSEFSAGQKKKVLIAKSLCEKAHLHIWDEPLNYIDVFSRMQIEELLLSYKPNILFVEHDSAFCQNIATKLVTL